SKSLNHHVSGAPGVGGLSVRGSSHRFANGSAQALSLANLYRRQPAYAVFVFGVGNFVLRFSNEPDSGAALLRDRRGCCGIAFHLADVLSLPLVRRTGHPLWAPTSVDHWPHHGSGWFWSVCASIRGWKLLA